LKTSGLYNGIDVYYYRTGYEIVDFFRNSRWIWFKK
jgi:hypothetical protein